MIITVTINPAVDKTVEVARLIPGALNRIKKVEYDAGGKGINVSKTIRELGGESIAIGFLSGSTGQIIESVLDEKGIRHDFIRIEGETRTNIKVMEEDGAVTELNEPGPPICPEHIEQLMAKITAYAGRDVLFVLSGSVPDSVDKQIYARMIRLIHEKGAFVLLDAEGELLSHAILEKPDFLKPNTSELAAYGGYDENVSEQILISLARSFKKGGIGTVVLSMGEKGAVFISEGYEVFSPALRVKAHSTVGAGDAMAAALAYAWEKKLDNEETVRLCMAASAGAVTTVGTKPPERRLVDELMQQVILLKNMKNTT
ncbi:MAG: 1-phosphofructokinase [Lachnospiraceae bacterium]|nr:1-phosphofructokinase [Lachnospiraceae bacterium]